MTMILDKQGNPAVLQLHIVTGPSTYTTEDILNLRLVDGDRLMPETANTNVSYECHQEGFPGATTYVMEFPDGNIELVSTHELFGWDYKTRWSRMIDFVVDHKKRWEEQIMNKTL
jgi:hypothetical protein